MNDRGAATRRQTDRASSHSPFPPRFSHHKRGSVTLSAIRPANARVACAAEGRLEVNPDAPTSITGVPVLIPGYLIKAAPGGEGDLSVTR